MALLSVGAIRGRQTWRIDTFRKSPRGSLVLSGSTKTWGRFSWVSSTPTCFCIRGSPELARAQHIPTWSSVRCATTYRRAKHRVPHKLDFIPVLEVHTDAGGTQERSGVGLGGELSSCGT